MNRPKLWSHLPLCIQESLIQNCDLEYDPYESSRAEARIDLLDCGDNETYNWIVVQKYYESIDDVTLKSIISQNIDILDKELARLREYRLD